MHGGGGDVDESLARPGSPSLMVGLLPSGPSHVGRAARPRLVMGGVAFTLLMGAELLVGVLLFGRTIQEHFALYRDASFAIGLAAQLTFALRPLLELRRSR